MKAKEYRKNLPKRADYDGEPLDPRPITIKLPVSVRERLKAMPEMQIWLRRLIIEALEKEKLH